MLDVVDMYAEWKKVLHLVATFPGLEDHIQASVARRSGKIANHPEGRMQLAGQLTGQKLLGVAALFRHEKAF